MKLSFMLRGKGNNLSKLKSTKEKNLALPWLWKNDRARGEVTGRSTTFAVMMMS